MKLSDYWFTGETKGASLGPIFIPPPPLPKNIENAQLLLAHVTDWVRAGNHDLEMKAWESLAKYAKKQIKKPLK